MRIFGLVAITMVGLLVGGGAWICNAIYGANLYVDPDCHAMPLYSRDSAKLLVADNPLAHRIDPAVYAGVVSVTFPARDGKVAVAGLLSPPPSGAPAPSWPSPAQRCTSPGRHRPRTALGCTPQRR